MSKKASRDFAFEKERWRFLRISLRSRYVFENFSIKLWVGQKPVSISDIKYSRFYKGITRYKYILTSTKWLKPFGFGAFTLNSYNVMFWNLSRHRSLHDNDCFECAFCPWKSAKGQSAEITTHLTQHWTETGSHKCLFCDVRFFRKRHLKRHEESFHEKIQNRYSCKDCHFMTYSSEKLYQHVKNKHRK